MSQNTTTFQKGDIVRHIWDWETCVVWSPDWHISICANTKGRIMSIRNEQYIKIGRVLTGKQGVLSIMFPEGWDDVVKRHYTSLPSPLSRPVRPFSEQ